MKPARTMARFNKRVTNRVQGLWAPYLPPWVMVVHRGRRSGRSYRTPVVASVRNGEFVVALLYGEDSDWVRNLLAANEGEVIRRGHTLAIRDVRVIDRAELTAAAGLAGHTGKRVLVATIG